MQILTDRLLAIKQQHLTRQLLPNVGIDLNSNDYLGFSQDKILRNNFIQRLQNNQLGSGGSRLLGGNLAIHEETEAQLARFVNRQATLIFPTGYQANIALFSALLKQEDMVFSDEYNHASIIDGIRISKAKKIVFPHRDYQILAEKLKKYSHSKHLKLIISESLFSMDGTVANIAELAHLAASFNALLIIDEAHSTGLWGPSLVATLGLTDQVFATIHTGGKALGAAGAWIAGNNLLKKYLINFARPFIFSTAPLPSLLILLQEAIKHYRDIGKYRATSVLFRAHLLRQYLAPFVLHNEESPIIPIILGSNEIAIKISKYLRNLNWQINAIRPPSVPPNSARLRITVKWINSLKQLRLFANDMRNAMEMI